MEEDVAAAGYELVYREAVRALTAQREAFESLRTRAGVVLSGAAIASSLFGGQAVAAGRLGPFGWAAVAAFAGLGLALLVVLWPRSEWQASPLPSRVIRASIEAADPAPVSRIHRDLALYMERVYKQNRDGYVHLSRSFRLAIVLLNVEVLAWVLDLATKA